MKKIKVAWDDAILETKPKPEKKSEEEILAEMKPFIQELQKFKDDFDGFMFKFSHFTKMHYVKYFPELGHMVPDMISVFDHLEYWAENGNKIIERELESLKPNLED